MTFAQGNLDLSNERSPAETEILINKLIDAWLRGHGNFFQDVLHHDWCEKHINYYYENYKLREPSEKTLTMTLATSAIVRGDRVELQTLLDQCLNLRVYSDVLKILLLRIIADNNFPEILHVLRWNELAGAGPRITLC